MRNVVFVLIFLPVFGKAQVISDLMINNQEAKRADWIEYESAKGSIKVGDTLMIGPAASDGNDRYTTLNMYKYSGYKAAMLTTTSPVELQLNGAQHQQNKVVVEAIMTRGTRKRMFVVLDLILAENKGGISGNFNCVDTKKALELGELINGSHLTRDMAIEKLKEAKDLLDLGLIDQAEYDTIKSELTPVIMNK
jgi:hypothetical protein